MSHWNKKSVESSSSRYINSSGFLTVTDCMIRHIKLGYTKFEETGLHYRHMSKLLFFASILRCCTLSC